MAYTIPPRRIAAFAIWLGIAQFPLAQVAIARADDFAGRAARVHALEIEVAAARMQVAQMLPPGNVPGADTTDDSQAAAPPAQDPGGLDVRIDRLENQMRGLTGQIEQAQYQIRRLEDDLKRLQQDVDTRLQGARVPQRRADLSDQPPVVDAPPAMPPRKRSDAFDAATQPEAPGAPRPLGTTPPSPPLNDATTEPPPPKGQVSSAEAMPDTNGPLDLSKGAAMDVPSLPQDLSPGPSALPGPSTVSPAGPATASLPNAGTPREEFDRALGFFKQAQYESAQTNFEAFLQKYPKDRLAADAVYFLGESFAQRGRYREAAEQFLKVATDYSKSQRAPEGLVRLGTSLNALGAKEQACATFGEVTRKYPNASAAVRSSVERESKRAKC